MVSQIEPDDWVSRPPLGERLAQKGLETGGFGDMLNYLIGILWTGTRGHEGIVMSQFLGTGNPFSATQAVANYLVDSLQPSFETIRSKIAGKTVRQRILHLYPPPSVGVFGYVRDYQLDVTRALPALPEWFGREEYAKIFSSRARELISSDSRLAKTLAQMEGNAPTEEKIAHTTDVFDDWIDLGRQALEAAEKDLSNTYFLSDFPFEYFSIMRIARQEMIRRLDIISNELRSLKLRVGLVKNRGLSRINQEAESFRLRVQPYSNSAKEASTNYFRLEIYVNSWNSTNFGEFFGSPPLSRSKVNGEIVKNLIAELDRSVRLMKDDEATLLVDQPTLYYKMIGQAETPVSEVVDEMGRAVAATFA